MQENTTISSAEAKKKRAEKGWAEIPKKSVSRAGSCSTINRAGNWKLALQCWTALLIYNVVVWINHPVASDSHSLFFLGGCVGRTGCNEFLFKRKCTGSSGLNPDCYCWLIYDLFSISELVLAVLTSLFVCLLLSFNLKTIFYLLCPKGDPDSFFSTPSFGFYAKTNFHSIRKKTSTHNSLWQNTQQTRDLAIAST